MVVYVILLEMTAAAAQSARDVTVNETRTDVWTDDCRLGGVSLSGGSSSRNSDSRSLTEIVHELHHSMHGAI